MCLEVYTRTLNPPNYMILVCYRRFTCALEVESIVWDERFEFYQRNVVQTFLGLPRHEPNLNFSP